MKEAEPRLSWMSPERRGRYTRKNLHDSTGRKLIMLGKKQYGMVDSDKEKELHFNNEWITAVNLKLAYELICVGRLRRHDMIENQDSELRRIAEEELKLEVCWTEWLDLQKWLAWEMK